MKSINRYFIGICIMLIALGGCGEKRPKVYRVGIISEASTMSNIADGFKAKMAELGYVDRKNILYDFNITNFNSQEEQRILKKFVDEKVDLIFAFPTEAALAVKAATRGTKIPVIFAQSMIEGNKLVENIRQPGGNITGVRDPGPDVTVKRLEILHELIPQAKKVYINYDLSFPAIAPALKALRTAALLLGVELVETNCRNIAEIKNDLQKRNIAGYIGIDAILTMGQPLTVTPAAFMLLSEFAARYRIPIGGVDIPGDQNSVFVYESKFYEIGSLAAPLADKIFKGIPAGIIPVVTPEAYLKINYKAAKKMGLKVSEGLLSRANQIIR